MLAEWSFEPGTTYLNHGTVGVTPRRIMAVQQEIRDADRAPSEPRSCCARSPPPASAGRCSTGRGCAPPPTRWPRFSAPAATTSCSWTTPRPAPTRSLRSFPLEPGDEVLVTDLVLRRRRPRAAPSRRASAAPPCAPSRCPTPFAPIGWPTPSSRPWARAPGWLWSITSAPRARSSFRCARPPRGCARAAWRCSSTAPTPRDRSRWTSRRSAWTGMPPTSTSGAGCRATAASCGRRPHGRRACTPPSSPGNSTRGSRPSSTGWAPATRPRTCRPPRPLR